MRDMSELARSMPCTIAFPHALGTGLIIHTNRPVEEDDRDAVGRLIEDYERTLSRFREDSLVTAIGRAEHGGSFDLPDWTIPLLDLYDALHEATGGALDPCVGEDLTRLGYDARYTFRMSADAHGRLGAIHGRAVWRNDIERHGSTLTTRRPIRLDFGACGKGHLVDLIADRLGHTRTPSNMRMVIDAGGDLYVRSDEPITIGMEDPRDDTRAIGTITMRHGSCCASAPSRRHWSIAAEREVHHLVNAIDGRPVEEVAAAWVTADEGEATSGASAGPATGPSSGQGDGAAIMPASAPAWGAAALADGLATALFVTAPERLARRFAFECAVLRADRTLLVSRGFPGVPFVQ